ncbi:MAG: hypothetical protein ACK5WR_19835, partial [Planctomycetaceae bacterium]
MSAPLPAEQSNRRSVLGKLALGGGAAALLAGCQPAAGPGGAPPAAGAPAAGAAAGGSAAGPRRLRAAFSNA